MEMWETYPAKQAVMVPKTIVVTTKLGVCGGGAGAGAVFQLNMADVAGETASEKKKILSLVYA